MIALPFQGQALCHSRPRRVVVNLDIAPAEESDTVWIDPNHLAQG